MSALQFLLLESNLPDAEVVQATLREGGIDCELLRVDTCAAFIRALESNAIDLILADYALSSFDEIAALTIARRLRPEIPFIFISGSLGEELAIEAIKQGATDYVLKQRLGRLVPSVQRALQEVVELDKDTIECKQAQVTLRESEAKYRSLFNSIDEGFCIFQLLFDDEGNAVDWIYLETNRAFEGQTGFVNAVGKRISELQPDLEHSWFEQFARIARTGEPVRLIDRTEAMDRWYDVYALRVGAAGDNRISLLFRDITDVYDELRLRKRREANLAFLADIENEFASLTSSSEIANVAGDRITEYFNLSHCLLVEIDEQATVATVFHDHKAADLPSLVGDYVIQDFHTEAEAEQLAAGQPLVINDALSERHSEENAARFEALGNRSLVTVPYVRDGRWKFALSAQDREPRWWRKDEIEFLQELAIRVSLCIERARAEAALRESSEKFRAFLSATSDIIYEMSADWQEMRSLAGKEFIATTKDPRRNWTEDYIPETDKPQVWAAINRAIATRSNFELEHRVIQLDGTVGWTFSRAIPLMNETGEIVKWFGAASDITAWVEAEAVLRESEAKYRSLFNSIDEGFCLFEMIYDETPKAVDYRFLEVNRVFEQQTGLENVAGKLGSEIAPNTESYWLETYNNVVKTGKPQRIENYNQSTGRWYQAYASRVGKAGSRQICTVFNDITDRKRHDTNLAFLAEVSQDLARLTNIDETMNALGKKIGRHFDLSACAFAELYESAEIAVIDHSWSGSDMPSLLGTYRTQEFFTPEVRRLCLAGEDVVIRDVFDDPLTDGEQYATLNIGSFLSIPLVRNGEWRFLLVIYHSEPHDWRDDEIELTRELANRIWTRLERALAEVGLRESEEKYRSLFTTMAQGFCIIEKIETAAGQPSDFRYLTANPAFEHHTGMHDVVGKTIRELVPDAEEPIMDIYDEVVRTGQPQQFENYVTALNLWMEAEVFPAQMPGQIAVLFSNVSERKRAEARLRRAAEMDAFRIKLSDALRSLADPVQIQAQACRLLGEHLSVDRAYYVETNEAEGYTRVNQNYLRGDSPSLVGVYRVADYDWTLPFLKRGEAVIVADAQTSDIIPEADREIMAAVRIAAHITSPLIKAGELVGSLCVTESAPREWLAVEVELVRETAERIWATIIRARAETELRESEIGRVREQAAREQERQRAEALAELDRAKTLFFSNVSHEFRTPLTLILAPVQDALSDSVNPLTSSQREQLELAHRNSLRLLKLVNTLLDFSRIEADRLKANYEPTDLSTYTAELASVFRSAIENANLQLVVDCPPLPDPIYVDREMWEKIVLNLLSNALKFTFEGIISVSLKPVKEAREQGSNSSPLPLRTSAPLPLLDAPCLFVELMVSDTGLGISASELPHLFERFYQVKGAKGRSYEGSGIGLSLVQELVKRHGGAIAVTSAVDQGATFTVTIPTGIAHLPADQIWVASTLASTAVTANAFVEEALCWLPEESIEFQLQSSEAQAQSLADFSRDLENPSPNLSPTRREALISPPSLVGKGAGGLGFPLAFPDDVKTQQSSEVQTQNSEGQAQNSEVQPQSSEVQPQSSEVQPQSSEVQPQSSEVQPQNSEVQPQNSEVQAQNSEVQVQNSEVQAQSSEVHAQSSEVQAQNSKRARILLVDDNADMRGYLKRLLNQYYEVEAVNDGLAALTAIRSGGNVIYDLVLADVMMPRMDGFELLRSLRASPNTQTIPIILLSARAGEESRVQGLETGADDYLIKPFSARELLARVNVNIQLAQLRREAVYREQVMQAVQTLNDRLEQQVKARTAQLEAINQELEAFSSSVSHDLRTPLRYISSFAERLQGKLNATLVDASSLQTLNIITKSALEAEKMVDDLLEFSRLGKTEMHLTTVNISQLVQEVREQLQPELVGRSLHWEIEPLAMVEADPVLLRLVLQNLLSNAVKYTRNNTEAAIAIGGIEQEQEVIFFVKDNGAGFDMKYCDRLFSIFQRLHPQEEFPGTGVGLATARRIIHRHGGRIWAEGAIGEGATFYCSLPKHEV